MTFFMLRPEYDEFGNAGDTSLWNVGNYLQDNTVSQPRKERN
jgi:hypothetical protein